VRDPIEEFWRQVPQKVVNLLASKCSGHFFAPRQRHVERVNCVVVQGPHVKYSDTL
jgi:hypothetical protein